VRIRFECGLDSRIYGNSAFKGLIYDTLQTWGSSWRHAVLNSSYRHKQCRSILNVIFTLQESNVVKPVWKMSHTRQASINHNYITAVRAISEVGIVFQQQPVVPSLFLSRFLYLASAMSRFIAVGRYAPVVPRLGHGLNNQGMEIPLPAGT